MRSCQTISVTKQIHHCLPVTVNNNTSPVYKYFIKFCNRGVTEVLSLPLVSKVASPSSSTKQQQTLQPRFARLIKDLGATP